MDAATTTLAPSSKLNRSAISNASWRLVSALRRAITLWRGKPRFWAKVLGVSPASIAALIEHGDEVCEAADFALNGDAG